MQYSDTEISWLAGILDGEGCLYVRLVNVKRLSGGHLEMRIEVHAASRRMVDAIEDIYQRIGVDYCRPKPKWQPLSTKETHKIQISRKASISKLLRLVLPYLRVKDAEARAILAFRDAFPDRYDTVSSIQDREALVLSVKSLKRVA